MTCPLSIAIARGLQLRRCRASIACDRRSARAKIDQLIQASHDSPGSGSTLDQRVTLGPLAIIPIDAQPLGTNGFGRAAGRNDREDFRHPPLAGPAAGCGSRRAPKTSLNPVEAQRKESPASGSQVIRRSCCFSVCRVRYGSARRAALSRSISFPPSSQMRSECSMVGAQGLEPWTR